MWKPQGKEPLRSQAFSVCWKLILANRLTLQACCHQGASLGNIAVDFWTQFGPLALEDSQNPEHLGSPVRRSRNSFLPDRELPQPDTQREFTSLVSSALQALLPAPKMSNSLLSFQDLFTLIPQLNSGPICAFSFLRNLCFCLTHRPHCHW